MSNTIHNGYDNLKVKIDCGIADTTDKMSGEQLMDPLHWHPDLLLCLGLYNVCDLVEQSVLKHQHQSTWERGDGGGKEEGEVGEEEIETR